MRRQIRHILLSGARRARLRRWLRREEGSATIEFVLFFPLIMFLFLSSVEVGVYLMRTVLLERAVDINVRTLRLGTLSPATSDELRRRICNDALVLSDCTSSLTVELVPISTSSWDLPDPQYTCVNRDADIDPAVDFSFGTQNELMLVRVCMITDPFFETTPLVLDMPLDDSGGYALVAASTFVNEP